jgi:hypothetical protein
MVVTVPLASMRRIRELSSTKATSLASMTIPAGALKVATVPVPSVVDDTPFPASVVTTCEGEMTRMRWLYESQT